MFRRKTATFCNIVKLRASGIYLCLEFVWLKQSLYRKLLAQCEPIYKIKNIVNFNFTFTELPTRDFPLITKQISISKRKCLVDDATSYIITFMVDFIATGCLVFP